ncbi:transcription termination factor Rho [Pseudonocardia sp. EC080610-09]|uniref:transcription termination factor Rho n=1 Tax=unclassified Pseudonocardia TaxID=2619320 RepID=UPI000706041A|nr:MULTISPECIES: transcription termination factor Rho [unclassified Pseudonocardia]ALL75684.1 transcription termination factor Rho [Pseudonocardia sp. EC080610-09]ALL82712.1 transcription termination factor Rho [Pseudonocardia sp. EC080619-01]
MSETDLAGTGTASNEAAPRRRGGLSGMVLAELRQLATELNVPDISGMRKGDLIAAIKERQGGAAAPARKSRSKAGSDGAETPQLPLGDTGADTTAPAANGSGGAAKPAATEEAPAPRTRRRRAATRPAGAPESAAEPADAPASTPAEAAPVTPAAEAVKALTAESAPAEAPATTDREPKTGDDRNDDGQDGGGRRARTRRRGGQGGDDAPRDGGRDGQKDSGQKDSGQKDSGQKDPGEKDQGRKDAGQRDAGQRDAQSDSGSDDGRDGGRGRNRNDGGNDRNNDRNNDNGRGGNDRNDNGRGGRNRNDDNDGGRNNRNRNRNDNNDDLDDDGDGRGRRGRRFRDRRRGRDRERTGGGGGNVDTEIRDDDVLLPVAGIVDILDNYAFVRTTGYLSGPTDVYVSMSMVRKNGLRRGDAITGAVRQPREGEQQRQKFNPLVRVDTINGRDPESARQRAEFTKLTPLYPNERLRLETDPTQLTTRVIDLVMPVGKGQRALIVSPPKAGKTTIMQNIANAITTNNPECHLMVVLVDERPEEVTDMQRSVKGEVIASTFDRPPSDHTTVAELSIERAKRLVEMGHDVVVLLDNITRLGRAYNLAAPASGRILSGGVDSTALYPPKRFLGAARNIEDGGSLTIFATALVETGSTMDTVIFEEFKGTGNAELKLDRKIADKRVFPAIDVGDSGTRKEELLMSPDEHAVMVKLRRVLSALDDQQAIDLVLDRLKKTKTNIEFLMQVAKNAPGKDED